MEHYKKKQLLNYLQFYLSKRLNMEIVLVKIVEQLRENKPISERQFKSIIKFIERERPFITMDRNEIRNYFDGWISNHKIKENHNGHTLCEFFT